MKTVFRKLVTIVKYTFIGIALYVLLSQFAQSTLYAFCYSLSPNAQGVFKDILKWFMEIDATTIRIMMTLIVLSIVASHSFLRFIISIALGWIAMMLWRLSGIQAPVGMNMLFSDACFAFFVASWAYPIVYRVVAKKPRKKCKKVQKKQRQQRYEEEEYRTQRPQQRQARPRQYEEEERPAQRLREPREEDLHRGGVRTNQETQRIQKVSDVRETDDVPRRRRKNPDVSWERAAEEAGLYRYNGSY